MSAAQSRVESVVKPMQVVVVGKIVRVRRYQAQQWFTTIITPAADVYSRPAVVQVRSKSRLGDPDQEVRLTCKLGGYERRSFRMTDRETGEIQTVVPVEMTLEVIE